MVEALWLIHHGIPFDVAFSLDDTTRGAFAIAFGNMERPKEQQFDWDRWEFPEPRT